ncbi:MAG: helix-turn-helix domain-containing protein [Candidatus Acidiferrales bacterium]
MLPLAEIKPRGPGSARSSAMLAERMGELPFVRADKGSAYDQGLTNKEIASDLHISEQTVKNHVHRIMRTVGAKDRLQVIDLTRT